MNYFNPQAEILPRILATDLDGTLIPLPGNDANVTDLQTIAQYRNETAVSLIFATGRHFESVVSALSEYKLPQPDWIICDVGSSIYHLENGTFKPYAPYLEHLTSTTGGIERASIEQTLQSIDGLELQSPDHQQLFKISYQCGFAEVDTLVTATELAIKQANLPFDCMGSIDPFDKRGLIDVLPAGVSKAYALIWLSTHADFTPDEVVYSGDSGNDLAALISGFRAIVVENGSDSLKQKVHTQLAERNLSERLYIANKPATSGVLEGCRHFGLFK
jgi:HAD superfamily hydrolase (TIGR01484 family)